MTLLKMSIYGAVIILVILIIRAFTLHKLPKKTFLVLWAVALLRLLVPFEIASGFSLYSLLPEELSLSEESSPLAEDKSHVPDPENPYEPFQNYADYLKSQEEHAQQENAPKQEDDTVIIEPGNSGTIYLPTENSDITAIPLPDAEADAEYAGSILSPENSPASGADSSDNSTATTHTGIGAGLQTLGNRLVPLLPVLWAVGALLCAAFFLISYLRCRLEFNTSLPVTEEYAAEWLKRHPLKRRISIRQSDKISAPLTYGIFRPVILLPKKTDWTNLTQLEYVLYHEFTHIRRFDLVAKLVMIAALCLHWFNPFVWAMYFFFNRDLELSCDDCVVKHFGEEKASYANTLIGMEEKKNYGTPLCNHFSKNAIEERITAIMKSKKTTVGMIVTAVVIVLAVVITLTTGRKTEDVDSGLTQAETVTPVPTESSTPSVTATPVPTGTAAAEATPPPGFDIWYPERNYTYHEDDFAEFEYNSSTVSPTDGYDFVISSLISAAGKNVLANVTINLEEYAGGTAWWCLAAFYDGNNVYLEFVPAAGVEEAPCGILHVTIPVKNPGDYTVHQAGDFHAQKASAFWFSDICKIQDKIYFNNGSYNGSLWVYDITTGEMTDLSYVNEKMQEIANELCADFGWEDAPFLWFSVAQHTSYGTVTYVASVGKEVDLEAIYTLYLHYMDGQFRSYDATYLGDAEQAPTQAELSVQIQEVFYRYRDMSEEFFETNLESYRFFPVDITGPNTCTLSYEAYIGIPENKTERGTVYFQYEDGSWTVWYHEYAYYHDYVDGLDLDVFSQLYENYITMKHEFYYGSLESTSHSYNTSSVTINGVDHYYKVTDERFPTLQSVIDYMETICTPDFAKEFRKEYLHMESDYPLLAELNGELYTQFYVSTSPEPAQFRFTDVTILDSNHVRVGYHGYNNSPVNITVSGTIDFVSDGGWRIASVTTGGGTPYFDAYNGEKLQVIECTEEGSGSPAICNDIVFYRAGENETLEDVLIAMKTAILEQLTIPSENRAFTVTSYDVTVEQPYQQIDMFAWRLPILTGYYAYEGIDLVSFETRQKEGDLDAEGRVPFLAQGSEEGFYFILLEHNGVYRLQREVAAEAMLNGTLTYYDPVYEEMAASGNLPTTGGPDWYNAVDALRNGLTPENTTALPHDTIVPDYVASALQAQAAYYLELCGLGAEHHADCYAVCETNGYTVYAADISYTAGHDDPDYFTVYHAYKGSELADKVILRHLITFYDSENLSGAYRNYINMDDVVTMAREEFAKLCTSEGYTQNCKITSIHMISRDTIQVEFLIPESEAFDIYTEATVEFTYDFATEEWSVSSFKEIPPDYLSSFANFPEIAAEDVTVSGKDWCLTFLDETELPRFQELMAAGGELSSELIDSRFPEEGSQYLITLDGISYYFYSAGAPKNNDRAWNIYIMSPDYPLSGGARVGMTEPELLALYPDLAGTGLDRNDPAFQGIYGSDHFAFRDDQFPESFLKNYDYAYVAYLDKERDGLPVCIAFLMKNGAVGAITVYMPTAG